MSHRAAGFTLLEAAIALALGGLLLGGLSSAAASAAQRHAELQSLALLQEQGQHALAILEPELQLAGFGGLAPLAALPWPSSLPAAVQACGTAVAPFAPLRVDGEGYVLDCPAQGGGAVPDSHVVTLLRASARPSAPEVGRLQLLSSRRAGEIQGLLSNGQLPSGARLEEGVEELHDLLLVSFYVARQAEGAPDLPALRMKELTAIEGRPTLRDVELVAGVEDLCVERPSAGSARVTVRLRANRRLPAAVTREYTCGGRRQVPRDGLARIEMSRTFALRNAAEAP